MALKEGSKLPGAQLMRIGESGPETVDLGTLMKGRRIVLFAVPGAFTPTCDSAHVPSFIRTAGALREKGIEEIACISVNDPHVMRAWGESTGAAEAGIAMLSDPEAAFTRAVGMEFSAPAAGMLQRSKRYAAVVNDGVVEQVLEEEGRGTCEISGGENVLANL